MTTQERGVVDVGTRILAQLLKKPGFKDNLRAFLNNLDPQASPELVRTLLWKDPEVILGIVGALPAMANIVISAFDELLFQVREKYPPPLLNGFVEALLDEMDHDTLAHALTNTRELMEQISPIIEKKLETLDAPGRSSREVNS